MAAAYPAPPVFKPRLCNGCNGFVPTEGAVHVSRDNRRRCHEMFADRQDGNSSGMLLRRVARPLLSAAFLGQGIQTLLDTKSATEVVRPTLEGLQTLPGPVGAKVPDNAAAVARINAAVQIGGGLLLATGRIPRVASAILTATVIPANLGQHMFWTETDPERKAQKRQAFLTDLSLIGGLVLASADTAGKPSLAWRGRRARRRVADAVMEQLPSNGESEFAEKIGHGLQTGVERGRELAGAALEKGAPLAESALRRGAELAETAREQGGEQIESGWRRLRQQI